MKAKQDIMTKPLPDILEELEEAIESSKQAEKEAKLAAAEAREAGLKAGGEAQRAVDDATKLLNQRINEVLLIANQALALAKNTERRTIAVLEGSIETWNKS